MRLCGVYLRTLTTFVTESLCIFIGRNALCLSPYLLILSVLTHSGS